MIHEMKLNPQAFEQIQKGLKTAEIRLYDEKRKLINIGDQITFRKLPDLNDILNTKVVGLTVSSDFKHLFAIVSPVLGGWEKEDTAIKASEDMGKYYSKEDEGKYGVLAIHLECL